MVSAVSVSTGEGSIAVTGSSGAVSPGSSELVLSTELIV